MNMKKKLTAHILIGFTLMTLSHWSFAEQIDTQAPPAAAAFAQPEHSDPFVAWDDKVKSLLAQQLVANGFNEKQMEADAAAVNTIKDKTEFEKAKLGFYDKYLDHALQGLRGLAALAKSPEADTLIINMERVLQSRPQVPEGAVPGNIAYIYQQIAISVLDLSDSPCITPMTRLGCLFALMGNKECAYIPPSAPPSSIVPVEWRFPASPIENHYRTEGAFAIGSWSTVTNDVVQFVTISDTDIVTSAPPVGFKWPLRATDHTMCVEMTIGGLANELFDGYIGWIGGNAPGGYARGTANWSMTLNGYGRTRISDCGFALERGATLDYHYFNGGVLLTSNSKACWFRDLEEVYSRTLWRDRFHLPYSIPILGLLRASISPVTPV